MSGKQTTKAILIKEDRPMVLMGDMARLEGSFLAHPMSTGQNISMSAN